jgi:hypothetical protein
MSIIKGRDGWQGRDYIELGEVQIEDLGRTVTAKERIRVSTYKDGKGLSTYASFVRSIPSSSPGVNFEQHRVFHDFAAVVERNQVRATEKAVREQHTAVMGQVEWLKGLVAAHQQEVAAKKAERDRLAA